MVDMVRELSGISSVWVGVCVCVSERVHTHRLNIVLLLATTWTIA